MRDRHKLVSDPEYGYKHLDPLPTTKELEDFYRERYYGLVEAGGRAPDLRRFLEGGQEAQVELTWLSQTLWRDIGDILDNQVPKSSERRLLDIGCGVGHFGWFMKELGWRVVGIEPSREAADRSRSLGLIVYNSVEEYSKADGQRFDAVTALHVLEHVVDPLGLLQSARSVMNENGVLVIRVPNDFSAVQETARMKLNKEPWWISIPDHLYYFNFDSLKKLLEKSGFQPVDILGDFPMEFFLLFGEDYIGKPEVGRLCHMKRVEFELSMPPELKRNTYRSFARNGIGRNCLFFARFASKMAEDMK